MIDSVPPWWILSYVWLAGATLILIGVAFIVRRQRATHPHTARLLLIAAGFSAIHILTSLVRQFDPFAVGKIHYHDDGSLDFTSPATWQMLVMQWIYIAGEIAAWSLIAWAMLMRPDERAKRRPESAES